MPINLKYEPITLEKQDEYIELFSKCPCAASDYSFVNLWGWSEEYGLEWAWTDKVVWIRQTKPELLYWSPVGQWEDVHWKKIFFNFESTIKFIRIPLRLVELWQKYFDQHMTIIEERENWDYLYSYSELVMLKGNKFHKKKNLLNQFKKKYDFKFIPFKSDLIHDTVAMQEDWCNWRDCESDETLSSENRAILKILRSWDKLRNVSGAVLFVDNMIVAYTVAERLSEKTVVIHFEKGCPTYKGIYQAINQMYLENSHEDFDFVNREQDLGDEGLRKAKLSYHPVDFFRKYKVIFKGENHANRTIITNKADRILSRQ